MASVVLEVVQADHWYICVHSLSEITQEGRQLSVWKLMFTSLVRSFLSVNCWVVRLVGIKMEVVVGSLMGKESIQVLNIIFRCTHGRDCHL